MVPGVTDSIDGVQLAPTKYTGLCVPVDLVLTHPYHCRAYHVHHRPTVVGHFYQLRLHSVLLAPAEDLDDLGANLHGIYPAVLSQLLAHVLRNSDLGPLIFLDSLLLNIAYAFSLGRTTPGEALNLFFVERAAGGREDIQRIIRNLRPFIVLNIVSLATHHLFVLVPNPSDDVDVPILKKSSTERIPPLGHATALDHGIAFGVQLVAILGFKVLLQFAANHKYPATCREKGLVVRWDVKVNVQNHYSELQFALLNIG